jgi:large subunit ribosomal protein L2
MYAILKIRKPITSSQRHLIQIKNKSLKKTPLIKKNLIGLKNNAGRNNSGKITIRHKGGGHKKKYRKIDFTRTTNLTAITTSIEYDPNRNANIASVYNLANSQFFYILAPKKLQIGDIIKYGSEAETRIGHSLAISLIPTGSYIHNVSLKANEPGKISRSAGTFSQITEKTLSEVKIKLSSGEQKLISSKCIASIGIVSNELIFLSQLGKAGQSRWLNIRPSVRGVAMNPIDHPHGGGEGKKSGKKRSPWGKKV